MAAMRTGRVERIGMSQFKIYGRREVLEPLRERMSDVVHACAVDSLGLPADKRFHRFFPMGVEDFPTPSGRTDQYTVIEVLMFEGRTVATKKAFYARLYREFAEQLHIGPQDLEITIVETPRHDWGIRGVAGDELVLAYRVEQ
jgi:phenylpyruvate tautomerase PptA (4-oxalocrotonate tautomerase family)